MTVREAAHKLYQELFPHYQVSFWCQSIGVAENRGVILIFTRKETGFKKIDSYEGYPVEYKFMGDVEIG